MTAAPLSMKESSSTPFASFPRRRFGQITDRLYLLLVQTYESYLRAEQRACLAALENLHVKYAVTAANIEQRRDVASAALKDFLGGLGYA